ncbi:hypothetical protein AAEX63_13715 [Luteococcus sp. H138]|uniref:hypothetical protein n=1 Tax=unclassified Luteococcus TaxID=2639923 RepID=UPI00313C8AEC
MTEQHTTPTSDDGASAAPDTRRRPSGRSGWLRGGLALAAVGALGAGIVVLDPLGKRNPAPESGADVLPASVRAFAELDVEPDLLQRAEMVRFALRVKPVTEAVSLTEQGDLRAELWRGLVKGTACAGVDYDTAVKPWLGRKVAVALPSGSDEPVWALQVTDEQQARRGAATLAGCGALPSDAAYRDGFLVLATGSGQAGQVLTEGSSSPLATSDDYLDDRKRVGRQGLLNFWVTKQGMVHLLDSPAVAKQLGESGSLPGRAVAEIRAAGWRSAAGSVRMIEGTPELKLAAKATEAHQTSTTEMNLASLPQDTVLAFGISDGDQVAAARWPQLHRVLGRLGVDVGPAASRLKGELPGDAQTMLGKDLRVSFSPAKGATTSLSDLPMQVATISRGNQEADRVESLVRQSGVEQDGWIASRRKRTVVVSQDAERNKLVLRTKKRLIMDPSFKAAYATPEQGQIGFYANLAALGPIASDAVPPTIRPWVESLGAVGANAHNEDANYSVAKLRVTAR